MRREQCGSIGKKPSRSNPSRVPRPPKGCRTRSSHQAKAKRIKRVLRATILEKTVDDPEDHEIKHIDLIIQYDGNDRLIISDP
jgi:hypothetical protein